MIRTVAHLTATLIAGVAIAVSGAGAASAAPTSSTGPTSAAASSAIQTFTLTPTRITGFTWVAGQQQWAQPSFDRLARSAFQIQGSRFVMLQPDGYPTLFGSINGDGTFRAAFASTTGYTGSTTAEVTGQLAVSNGVLSIRMTYVSGATLAAVVNGTTFGNSRTKAFHAAMELRVV